jgi:tetratricopeptide (TPR) repeat protein
MIRFLIFLLLNILTITVKAQDCIDYLNEAIDFFSKKHYIEAIESCEKCKIQTMKMAYCLIIKGWANYEIGNYDQSIINFNEYIELVSDKGDLANSTHLYLARAYRKINDFSNAIYHINYYEMRVKPKPSILHEKAEIYLDYERQISNDKDKLQERLFYISKAKDILDKLLEMKYDSQWLKNDFGRLKLRQAFLVKDNFKKIELFEEARRLFLEEKKINDSNSVLRNIWFVNNKIAEVYSQLGWSVWNIREKATANSSLRDKDKAIYFFSKAVEFYKKADETYILLKNANSNLITKKENDFIKDRIAFFEKLLIDIKNSKN